MGETSRRRPAAKDQSNQVAQEVRGGGGGGVAGAVRGPRTSAGKSPWRLDKWEKLGLLSAVTLMTVRFLGPYVPGASVIVETDFVKNISGVIAGVSLAGILISIFQPFIKPRAVTTRR